MVLVLINIKKTNKSQLKYYKCKKVYVSVRDRLVTVNIFLCSAKAKIEMYQ